MSKGRAAGELHSRPEVVLTTVEVKLMVFVVMGFARVAEFGWSLVEKEQLVLAKFDWSLVEVEQLVFAEFDWSLVEAEQWVVAKEVFERDARRFDWKQLARMARKTAGRSGLAGEVVERMVREIGQTAARVPSRVPSKERQRVVSTILAAERICFDVTASTSRSSDP